MKIAHHGPDLASLQALVDSVPALIHTARLDGYIDFFNERWLEYVGLRLEDLEGWRWTAAVHPDDVGALVAKWRACLASGEPFEFESRVRRADGAYRWMLHQKLPLKNASGEIVKWYGSSVDIDDRKRAEYELRKHEAVHVTLEAQLQFTLNLIPAYTWYAAPSGALTFVNERGADYLGLPHDDPLRFGIDSCATLDAHLAFLHPDDHEHSRKVWSTCLKTRSAGGGYFRARNAAGAYRWFLSRVEPLHAGDGTLLYWVGINVDIEEQKQAEVYLAEGQRLGHIGSWAFSAAGFDYWSAELFRIHGLEPGGKAPSVTEYVALVHPDDRELVAQEIQKMLTTHRGFDFTKRIVRPDGRIRSVRCVGVPKMHGETFFGFVGTEIDVTEQDQLTKELQLRQAYLDEAQRLSRTGSFGWNVSTDEHFWSDETFRIFEFAPSATLSLPTILERVHPQDLPSVNTAVAAANRAEGIDLEFRLLMPDGRIKYLHVVATARRGESGRVEVIGAVTNVTARKLTEIEFRRSKAHLADAQRLSRTGSVGIEVSTKRIFWSDEAARIYGYPPGTEPTPDLILQRCHPDDVDRLKEVLGRAAQGGADFDFEHRLLMPDGSIKHLHNLAHCFKDEEGNEEIVGAIMDVTEHKAAEEKIREQEGEFRQMLDFAPQLVEVFGPTFNRLYANRMALSYLGVTLDEWLHREIPEDVHPEDAPRLQANVECAIQSGLPSAVEVRARGGDGTYRWFLACHNPVRDDKGQIVRWYAGLIDIEDRKRAEERLEQENVALREEVDKASMFEQVVGSSAALTSVLSRVSKVARSDSTVLITGETGTGKELVARAIHRRSNRSSRAFVSVSCAAIPRDLIASELFGHEKGAFTGALQRRLGRFELADGGTIFLDEVGELPMETQVALLRVLQEREFERVGGNQSIRVDVRVIAATNRDLHAAVASAAFRQDLFYRLNVVPITVPSLRERTDDIPVLVEYFINRYARKAGKTIRRVNKRTLDQLQAYPWPGNVRELQNVIERSVIVCDTEEFTVDESWLSAAPPVNDSRLALSSTLAAQEKAIIEEALRASGGRVFGPSGAAARLGIARSTLESKIRALGIDKNRFRGRSAKP